MKKESLMARVIPVFWLVLLIAAGIPSILVFVAAGRLLYLVAKDGITLA